MQQQQTREAPALHIAWDRLATGDAFGAVLGFVPTQKTTRTLCGRRVSMGRIAREDNPGRRPSCASCVEERDRQEREGEAALAAMLDGEHFAAAVLAAGQEHRHPDDIRADLQAARVELREGEAAGPDEAELVRLYADEYRAAISAILAHSREATR